ncbi:MAG: hypothetical protein SGBAC_002913 [Bacillariaceae sp.]
MMMKISDEEGVNEKEAEEETSLSKNQNTEIADKGSLFMSQMASNINQKVEEAHPTILSAKDSAEKINMDELDTKAKMKQWAGKYDKAAMQAKLQDRIATNPVFLLTYGTCPYCAKVINALKTYSAADAATGSNGDSNGGVIERQKMLIVDLDALPGLEKYALRTEVMELVDHNTIPALWVGGQFVGGYQQLEALQQQGNQEDGKDQFKILLEEAMNMNVNVNVDM